MARLIDADKFEVISLQGKSEEFCNGVMWMLEQIDKTPTAYDIDKVVEELNNERNKHREIRNGMIVYEDTARFSALSKAIEIVERGGKE